MSEEERRQAAREVLDAASALTTAIHKASRVDLDVEIESIKTSEIGYRSQKLISPRIYRRYDDQP